MLIAFTTLIIGLAIGFVIGWGFSQESRDENKCYYDSKLHNLCCPAFIHHGARRE
jgi:hypothetical protein